MKSIILARRMSRCLDIAEQLEKQFDLHRTAFDVDSAAALIDAMLPDSSIEAEERSKEIDDQIRKITRQENQGPGLGQQLREALGFHQGAPLKEVLSAAIKTAQTSRMIQPMIDEWKQRLKTIHGVEGMGARTELMACIGDLEDLFL